MSDERDAIERLERRVAQLEALVRQLAAGRAPQAPAPAPRPPPRQPPVAPPPPTRAVDLEQLIGQRGLLVVGVLALIATAGFFLKYAFERGWISPELRVLGGIVVGVAIAVFGERLVTRGMRGYGAALIGGGGGLVYLACWAAAGAYGLVPRPVGTGLLFATTAAVALRAVFHRVEGLAVWALIGAYLAPVFLPRPATEPAWFWGYLALVGFTAGALAHRHGWRSTLNVALVGYYVLAILFTTRLLSSVTGVAFLSAGGVGALLATATPTGERRWPEARIGGPALAWLILAQPAGPLTPEAARWTALAGGAAIVLVAWWQVLGRTLFAGKDRVGRIEVLSEDVVFILNPVVFALLASSIGPRALRTWGWSGLVPALTAALYLVPGWRRRRAPLVAMGFGLAALAVTRQWDGTALAAGLIALAVGAVAAEHHRGVLPGREVGVWLSAVALVQLFVENLDKRPPSDPAFVGSWALGWYIVTAGMLAAARLWPRPSGEPTPATGWEQALWVGIGASVFFGGSIELPRSLDGLAADLSISAFWIVYAGALVQLGFQRGVKAIRSAGLAVAGLAAAKIALYDLATLSALYRVGSFFILSLITLAVAYSYNRRAKA